MKIGIISLGLIGGSLYKALQAKGLDICAVTRNTKTIETIRKENENISDNLQTLKDCNIVFVCSPMNKTEVILDALEVILPSSTIVTDTCSLKEFITKKERPYKFIGSHPMAGTEKSGFEASFKELFNGAKWVITPNENTSSEIIETLSNVIKETGATPIITSAEEHDKAVALISHMPLIIAQALVETARENDLALKLASSGFRDMTRLALSNTEMANDMLTLNNSNIKDSLILLKDNIDKLLTSDYMQMAETIKNKRQKLYNSNGKNIYN